MVLVCAAPNTDVTEQYPGAYPTFTTSLNCFLQTNDILATLIIYSSLSTQTKAKNTFFKGASSLQITVISVFPRLPNPPSRSNILVLFPNRFLSLAMRPNPLPAKSQALLIISPIISCGHDENNGASSITCENFRN